MEAGSRQTGASALGMAVGEGSLLVEWRGGHGQQLERHHYADVSAGAGAAL